jgi:hypothetical protein
MGDVLMDKKYILLILSFISLYVTICLANETYAKYLSSATSTSSTSIARWKILVNNDDITVGATSTSLITPQFPGSDNISENVIAPNAEGYFDLVLDASNVDVSFNYTISIAPNENSPVTELVATKYLINGEEEIEFEEGENSIEGTVNLNDEDKIVNLRVYIKWDDTLNLMTNAQDTNTTVGNQAGLLDVTVYAIQV